MAQPIAADYGQQFIFPPALEDWVPKDHPVRLLRELVEQQDWLNWALRCRSQPKAAALAGTVTCPQNKQLDYGAEAEQKGQQVKKYGCHVKDCPVANLCKDSKGRRVIEIWPHTAAVQEMRKRLGNPEPRHLLKKRSQIIERHFGHIKQHDGF